jgi:general secretion pathway protein A
MYAPFFGLQQEAFSIAPDPRFLHLSAMHREALAHLMYGLQGGGGFVLLTGHIGTGKTTVCRCFLEQIPPGHQVGYIVNPKLTPLELLQTICQEFGVVVPGPAPTSLKPCIDALNLHLLAGHAAGHQCVLIVDEAQALSAKLLEMLRLLTNLETQERKLLQIVLVGQPELRDLLSRPELEQLAQRVIARVHLGPMQPAETADYVRHRMGVAGWTGELPFTARALTLVHRLAGGVPRRINLLCQRALLGAYATGTRRIGPAIVRKAAQEVFASPRVPTRGWWMAAGAAAVVAVAGLGWWTWPLRHDAQLEAKRPTATTVGSATTAGPTATPTDATTATTASAGPSAKTAIATRAAPDAFTDDATAWAALARLWQLQPTAGNDVCAEATDRGLDCHQGQADLPVLQILQRPALLQLRSGGLVLLQALDDQTALLAGGADGGPYRVRRLDLQSAWTGRFHTLWRTPPGWRDTRTAAAADWVLDRLTQLQGPLQGSARRPGRAEDLRQRVFAFQVSQGLPLDGLAGPITLMQINRASGVDEPRWRLEP